MQSRTVSGNDVAGVCETGTSQTDSRTKYLQKPRARAELLRLALTRLDPSAATAAISLNERLDG